MANIGLRASLTSVIPTTSSEDSILLATKRSFSKVITQLILPASLKNHLS